MKAEIVKKKSSRGRYAQVHFGGDDKNCMGIKFIDNPKKTWVGYFEKGEETGLSLVLMNEEESKSFVIADGEGYIVDTDARKLITVFDKKQPIVSAIKTVNPDLFVAGTESSIYVIGNDGRFIEILPDFDVDGFYFKEQQAKSAKGSLTSSINDFEGPIEFSIDLTSLNLKVNY